MVIIYDGGYLSASCLCMKPVAMSLLNFDLYLLIRGVGGDDGGKGVLMFFSSAVSFSFIHICSNYAYLKHNNFDFSSNWISTEIKRGELLSWPKPKKKRIIYNWSTFYSSTYFLCSFVNFPYLETLRACKQKKQNKKKRTKFITTENSKWCGYECHGKVNTTSLHV